MDVVTTDQRHSQRDHSTAAGVVIVAAGQSSRMGGIDKQFALLGERPVLAHTIAIFADHPAIGAIVVVAARERLAAVQALATAAGGAKLRAVVPGGARRQDSVRVGVEALPESEAILVHDGARPLVSAAIIDRATAAVLTLPAAVAVMPVADTIKRVDEAGQIVETPPRHLLRAAQTPQVFRRAVLLAAYAGVDWLREFTDEAALVEAAGYRVGTFAGAAENIKITLPSDLALALALWRLRQEGGLP